MTGTAPGSCTRYSHISPAAVSGGLMFVDCSGEQLHTEEVTEPASADNDREARARPERRKIFVGD